MQTVQPRLTDSTVVKLKIITYNQPKNWEKILKYTCKSDSYPFTMYSALRQIRGIFHYHLIYLRSSCSCLGLLLPLPVPSENLSFTLYTKKQEVTEGYRKVDTEELYNS
jgi:hypothetical protein